MKIPRRRFLHLAAGAAVLPAVSSIASAQTYPSRPITMIVPSTPGNSGDAVARVVAERMRQSLRQPIIIENVGGAGGNIATGRAAHARPDGYTIELGIISTHVLNGAFYSLPYDVLNDFAPISPLVTAPIVPRSSPASSIDKSPCSQRLNTSRNFCILRSCSHAARFRLTPWVMRARCYGTPRRIRLRYC
jgi:tripartite-type tricarboxylate transporter receptor subunit TctC